MAAVLIRLVAVTTVILSMGVMAVSAYAARTAPMATPTAQQAEEAADPNGSVAEPDGSAAADGAFSDVQSVARRPDDADGDLAEEASLVRFAPPDDASPLRLGANSGSNASSFVRVWQVPSIRTDLFAQGSINDIPPDQLVAMQQTADAFGLPWQLLAGIARVESDFGRNMAVSSAGAIGYGQFMPEQWAIYGAGGDPYDYHDALLAMARYLRVAGAPEDIPGAVHAYNHSWEYVELVLSYATQYGYGSSRSGSMLIWPALGPISSYMDASHPMGIDIDQTETPHANVWAAHAGTVVFAGGDPCCSYGNYVIVAGDSGIATLYGHFDALAVTQGQRVAQGETLGIVGCTGVCTGPHVHFEVIVNGERVDPLGYLPGG